jgi:hypothetical protein
VLPRTLGQERELAWARMPAELKADVWRLVCAGYHLEAHRRLVQETGDAIVSQAMVAELVKRKLHVHN